MTPTDNLFLQATRLKLRFPSEAGDLTVEDLWDLPIQAKAARPGRPTLESVGNALLVKQQAISGTSILAPATGNPERERIDAAVEVVRFVIQTRQAEAEQATLREARRQERESLDALIRRREAEETPLEDLKARREQLG